MSSKILQSKKKQAPIKEILALQMNLKEDLGRKILGVCVCGEQTLEHKANYTTHIYNPGREQ